LAETKPRRRKPKVSLRVRFSFATPFTSHPEEATNIRRPHFVVKREAIDAGDVRKSLYSDGQRKVAEAVRAMRTTGETHATGFGCPIASSTERGQSDRTAQRRVDLLEWVSLCEACGADPCKQARRLLAELARGR